MFHIFNIAKNTSEKHRIIISIIWKKKSTGNRSTHLQIFLWFSEGQFLTITLEGFEKQNFFFQIQFKNATKERKVQ